MPSPLFGREVKVRYDRTGQTYAQARQPDPRIAAVINEALRGIATAANIGAGAGSYEPAETIIAIEPSRVMIAQRQPGPAPAVQAIAERLPIRSNAVDAALAVLAVHHWSDLTASLRRCVSPADASSSSPGITPSSKGFGYCTIICLPPHRPTLTLPFQSWS